MNNSNVAFSGSFNYLKRALEGTDSLTTTGVDTDTITHDLGYIPSVRMFYNPGNGRIFPFTGSGSVGGRVLSNYKNDIYGNYTVGASNISYEIIDNGTPGKTVTVYYIIYLDEVPSA